MLQWCHLFHGRQICDLCQLSYRYYKTAVMKLKCPLNPTARPEKTHLKAIGNLKIHVSKNSEWYQVTFQKFEV